MSVIRLMVAARHRVTLVPAFAGPNIAQPRNELLEAFLKADDDYFLMVDTDIEFQIEDVDALIAADKDIVGGYYLNRYEIGRDPEPVGSVHLGDGEYGRPTPDNVGTDHGLVQLSGVGMGFTLIKRNVIEKLGSGSLWPFAEVAVSGDTVGAVSEKAKEITHMVSEDITFCHRAMHKGFEVWLNLDTKVRHHKMTSYL